MTIGTEQTTAVPADQQLSKAARAGAFIGAVVLALGVRACFLDYRSGDYIGFYQQWFEFIRHHGGFLALRHQFSNYNMPYLYLLAAASYLPLSPLMAVKLVPVVFDVLVGWFTYRILGTRYPAGPRALAGGAVAMLLPSVVLNSSMWGQADATYVACVLGALYYVLRRKPWIACSLFGLAVAFKLQAVFIFPLLPLLVLRKWLTWRSLLAIPGVFLLLDLPAILLGARPRDVFLVYFDQVTLNDGFTFTTPNVYQFLGGPTGGDLLTVAGVALTGAVVVAVTAALVLRRVELSESRVVLAAAVTVLLVPFLLPKMHERYFYLADVLTLVAAFWLPRRLWYVPALSQFASVFSYLPFLLLPFRLKESSGKQGIVDAHGFVSPKALLDLGSSSPEVLRHLLGPVVDFRLLAVAVLVALVVTLTAATREFRMPHEAVPSDPPSPHLLGGNR